MNNGLFEHWCDFLGIEKERIFCWKDQYNFLLEPSLISIYMSLTEISELLDSFNHVKSYIGFYLDLRENKFYEETKLLNHFIEAKKVSHILRIFDEFAYERYEQWNIVQHPENSKIFICWTHTGNPFPFVDWCYHIGIKKREICFYRYYIDIPPTIDLEKIDDLKFERMY